MIEKLPLLIFNIIWFILPPYIANMAPVIWGGGPPLDGGRPFFDGKRILGNAKTIRGTFVGILAGTIVGLLQHIAYPFLRLAMPCWGISAWCGGYWRI